MRVLACTVALTATLGLIGCAGGPFGQSHVARHFGRHFPRQVASHAPAHFPHQAATGGATGIASYYRAAGLTAAHRTLPFGTQMRVTNLSNGRSVVVRINDRGPFIRDRSIDLSSSAASAIGMTGSGLARVRMEVLQ